jgi:hypothetical protein
MRRSRCVRFGCGMLLRGARLVFAHRRRGRNRGPNDYRSGRRRNCDGRACCGNCACGGSGDHRACGWAGCNRWRRRGRNDNWRSGARLRHDLAWFRAGWLHNGRGDHYAGWWRWYWPGRRCNGSLRAHWRLALARVLLSLLLIGQDGFEHVAGLGDMGKIDFGLDALRGARGPSGSLVAGPRGALKLSADLIRLIVLKRTGVGLAAGQAKLRQYVKNLTALDFHLACEIVDSNLTHPPLFKMWCPKPVSRS